MTTIAACPKLRVIVCDSQTNDGDQKWTETKVMHINGSLYACCGYSGDAEVFYGWIRKGKRGPKPDTLDEDTFNALALTRAGLFWYDSKLAPMKRVEPSAIGSGGKCALAAMMAGADIFTAVQIACEIDAGSGGPVVTHKLKP